MASHPRLAAECRISTKPALSAGRLEPRLTAPADETQQPRSALRLRHLRRRFRPPIRLLIRPALAQRARSPAANKRAVVVDEVADAVAGYVEDLQRAPLEVSVGTLVVRWREIWWDWPVPSHEVSKEAQWLAKSWPVIREYEGRWIAVVGYRVWADDESLEALVSRADAEGKTPLFAFVSYDQVA